MPVALVLGGLSLVTFFAGAVMLGSGIAMSSGTSSGGGIFKSVLPSSDGAEKPGWDDGHPVGLYLMTRYWIATGSLEKASYYFTSDERVFLDLEEGFSEEMLARHEGRHGTVRIDGDDMIITWSDGKESRSALEKADGGFNWDAGIFAAMKPFEDDSSLAGRWEGGNSVSFGGGTTIAVATLDLREDGTFTRSGAASSTSNTSESNVTVGGSSTNTGKWALEGYSLIFTYDDGRVERGVTFPFDDEETPVFPDRFYFAGTLYKKL